MATKSKRPNFLDEPAGTQPVIAGEAVKPTREGRQKKEDRPDRIGKRGKLFYMNEAAEKQLSILAIEQDTTQQALLISAVNALFAKHGKPPIA
jgi:hypothetical protein